MRTFARSLLSIGTGAALLVACGGSQALNGVTGGASDNGGSGGSSYVEPTAKGVHMWRGWKSATDDGLVVLAGSEIVLRRA
jgi:hypothetical protein